MVLTNYAPGNHLLFSAAKNVLGARVPRVFPRQKPDSSPFSQSRVDVLSTCRVHRVWKGSFLCLFPLLLGSDAGIPTFLSISYLKRVPIGGEKNLSCYLCIMLSILAQKNLSLKKQKASELKSLTGNIWESKLPGKWKRCWLHSMIINLVMWQFVQTQIYLTARKQKQSLRAARSLTINFLQGFLFLLLFLKIISSVGA